VRDGGSPWARSVKVFVLDTLECFVLDPVVYIAFRDHLTQFKSLDIKVDSFE